MDVLVSEGSSCPTLSTFFLENESYAHGNPVLLTFDDALNCFYDQSMPALMERGLRATVFVITDFVGKSSLWDYYKGGTGCRHLDWGQLKNMSSLGIEIGSHSCTHPDLLSCGARVAEREITMSKGRLEDKLGVPVRFFSYPFGRVNARIEDLCRKAGYSGAVTMMPGSVNGKTFRLNRNAVYLFEGKRPFKKKIGLPAFSKFEQSKLRTINVFSMGTIILNNMKSK